MPRRIAKTRRWPPPPTLTADQEEKLSMLAKLGVTVSPMDAAKILDVPEARLTAYLAGERGAHLWAKNRAEGRAELVAEIRRIALEGNQPAQKMLAGMLAADDTRNVGELRLTGPDVRRLLGRSAEALNKRARCGDWIRPGADKCFALADIMTLIAKLWDGRALDRAMIDRLNRVSSQAAIDRAEADRQLQLERLRRQKRENEIAEGRLCNVEDIRRQTDHLLQTVRQAVAELAKTISLKLALPDAADRTVKKEAASTLASVAAVMAKGTHAG